ncbi:hypothetical protein COE94_20400 [Bacillus toyonensis]|nr:hypothetical protein CN603_17875 [Bacillus toyonensis]PHB82758.1 hypothetical protein COE94_20400 [Bacillus toyonensis]
MRNMYLEPYFNLNMIGVPPAFRKNPTLRACKILYSFSANPVTNRNLETRAMIGMYKKTHRIIEREKAKSHLY